MKNEIKIYVYSAIFVIAIFASFLFFGMRAKAASCNLPASYESLATLDISEIRDLHAAARASYEEPEWVNPLSQYEMDLLAALIWSEAGDQRPLFEGLCWVCDVVLNRVDSPAWPGSIESVIYQSGQFSVVSNGALARAYGNAPQICYDAIISQLQDRWNYGIIYFSMNGLANGEFAFVSDTHYFGY